MASSGKKGRKTKGTVLSLQTFLSNSGAPAGTTQVAKNIRNVDGDDSDDGENVHTVVCQLPTAPRANRIFDDSSVPHKAPFIAYITNLPFDVKEDDIYEYFSANNVKSVRLPREDGETGRVRGFGYVEFESRDDLIQSLGMRDPTIKGRRIRIDMSNENDQYSRQRGSKRGFDPPGSNSEGRDVSNWRRDNNTKRDSYSFNTDRNSRDQKSDENNTPGSWRIKNQSNSTISSSVEELHKKDHDKRRVDGSNTLERPRLMLKPRTLPLPELEVPLQITSESKIENTISFKSTAASAEKVFGSAKPVDTTARDLEIEERLADVRRQDNYRKETTKEITNGIDKLNLNKTENVIKMNWRQQNENVETSKNPERRTVKTDTRIVYVKENWKKYPDKTEGCDNQKTKEGKGKDLIKIKRESKVGRQAGKNDLNQNEAAVFTNKYSGLDLSD